MSIVEYKREGQIGYLTLNRPEKLNAVSDEMSLALCDALYALYDDEEAMVGILSGNGGHSAAAPMFSSASCGQKRSS